MSQETKYLVSEKRWLLYLFASKNPIWALGYALPLGGFWFWAWAHSSREVLASSVGLMAGILLWMFFEYVVHRYLYHLQPRSNSFWSKFLRSFHLYHHQNPEDRGVITIGIVPALLVSGTFAGLLYFVIPSQATFASMMLALTIYHYYYEWVHYLVHKRSYKTGHLAYLQRYHLHHHLNWKVNFGQTTTFIDRLFRTYEPVTASTRISVKHIFDNIPHSISYNGQEVRHD